MNTEEKLFDATLVTNLLLVLALVFSVLYYVKYAAEIQEEVTTVIMNSLNDVSNSLAQQESVRK